MKLGSQLGIVININNLKIFFLVFIIYKIVVGTFLVGPFRPHDNLDTCHSDLSSEDQDQELTRQLT